jgi:hypothetical protein
MFSFRVFLFLIGGSRRAKKSVSDRLSFPDCGKLWGVSKPVFWMSAMLPFHREEVTALYFGGLEEAGDTRVWRGSATVGLLFPLWYCQLDGVELLASYHSACPDG